MALIRTLLLSGEWDRKVGGVVPNAIAFLSEDKKIIQNGPLFRFPYQRLIIDEGHLLKNPDSIRALSVSALEAKFRWVSFASYS